MRRGFFFVLAVLALVAMSGKDAHAKLMFGTQDRIHPLQDVALKGPNGEALFLGFLTSMHSFVLPYSISNGGYVLGIKGTSDKFFKLPKERIEQLQRGGALPKALPVYQRSGFDYVIGYALWPALLIIGIIGFFQLRSRSGQNETRAA